MTERDTVLSPETIAVCLDLLSTVSVPVTHPDAEQKMQTFLTAHRELLAALTPQEKQEDQAT